MLSLCTYYWNSSPHSEFEVFHFIFVSTFFLLKFSFFLFISGLGRSKFLPKPMPPEINMLLAECDRNCHHEYTDTATPSSNKCGGNLETLEDDDDDENRVG